MLSSRDYHIVKREDPMVVASVAPCREPVHVAGEVVRWHELAALVVPQLPAQLVVRQALQLCEQFLKERVIQEFGDQPLPTDARAALERELAVHKVFALAADHFVHAQVEAAHRSDRFVDYVVGAAVAVDRVYSEGWTDVEVAFLGGSRLSVHTPYVLTRRRGGPGLPRTKRGKEGNGAYPVLRQIGIHDRASPGLISEIGVRVATSSIEEAHEDLTRRGVVIDRKTVRATALHLGARGLRVREHRLGQAMAQSSAPSPVRGKRLVVSTDGGKLKVRVGGKRGRRNKKTGRRRYRTKWVEPRVLAIHVIDEKGRKTRHEVGVLDATIAKADAVFRMLIGYLKLLGAHEAAHIVIVADGALWIWDRVDELIEEVGIAPDRVSQVVDYYHATERLAKVADLRLSWKKGERERWLKRVITKLWKGDIDAVLDECRALCRGCRSKKIAKLLDYFDRNRSRMQYARCRRLAIPMGSGVVESAVRRVVNLRLKGPGIIWEEVNAERLLHMRAQLKLGAWNEYVTDALTFVPQKECGIWISSGTRAAM